MIEVDYVRFHSIYATNSKFTDSAYVYTVYRRTVNTIQSWVAMHGSVATDKIGLLSCYTSN
jgi:hypothetical protein